jgi:hypothetical protein
MCYREDFARSHLALLVGMEDAGNNLVEAQERGIVFVDTPSK